MKARFFLAALYQPLKRLATIVTPRWGFVLQLVLRGVEANKVRASILAKLEVSIIHYQLYIINYTLFSRARDKKLKKSTESTARGCRILKYSYMPCSRFLKIGAFCSRFFGNLLLRVALFALDEVFDGSPGAATVDVGELAQFAGEFIEGGHLHGSAGTMFHLCKDGRGREPDAVG